MTGHLIQAHKKYVSSTAERTEAFKKLTQAEQEVTRKISEQVKLIKRNQERLQQLKARIAANTREHQERNKALQEEKDAIAGHYQELKKRMAHFREAEQRRLRELTIQSRAVIKGLESKQQLAEHILKLGELCRALETEQEKVLPFFPTAQDDPDVQKEVAEIMARDQAEAREQPREWSLLSGFFKRYNKSLLERVAMEHEYARLQQENLVLRSRLKLYLDGISVNETVLSQANPLLIVTKPTGAAPPGLG